jgi:hypothetical protein
VARGSWSLGLFQDVGESAAMRRRHRRTMGREITFREAAEDVSDVVRKHDLPIGRSNMLIYVYIIPPKMFTSKYPLIIVAFRKFVAISHFSISVKSFERSAPDVNI